MNRGCEFESYAEAWCENCGWRVQTPGMGAAMDQAKGHVDDCEIESPSVLGQHVELFRVVYS